MNQLWIITWMELKKIVHDRRRLAVLTLGPIILCLIFGYSAYTSPENIRLAVLVDSFFSISPSGSEETHQIIDRIDDSTTFAVTQVYSLDDAIQLLNRGQVRGIVVFKEGQSSLQKIEVTVDVTDRLMQQTISAKLPAMLDFDSSSTTRQTLSTLGVTTEQTSRITVPFTVQFTTNENRSLTQFDLGASGVIVLFVVGTSLIMASIAITSERTLGTIERIFASPFKRWTIILSKVMANSLFSIIIAVIVWLTLKIAFDITMGNLLLVLAVTVLVSINAIILGLLISSITYSELESVLVAVLSWLIILLMMGIYWPLETMHPLLNLFSQVIPYTYALQALRNINLIDWSLVNVWPFILILVGFIIVQTLVATFVLRREIR